MSTNQQTEAVDLSVLTPSEVDEIGYAAYEAMTRAMAEARRNFDWMRRALRFSEKTLPEEVLEAARSGADLDTYAAESLQRYLARYDEASAKVRVARAEVTRVNAEWDRRGRWTRAFLVIAGDGHVHRSMNCSTCNRGKNQTEFQWMTAYSDLDEAQIVAAAGWRACTICYPTAPVGDAASLPTAMFSREDETKAAARAEREAKAAARNAKAIAAGLTADGSPLVVTYIEHDAPGWDRDPVTGKDSHVRRDRKRTVEFKTERTATTYFTDYVPFDTSPGERGDREPVFAAIEAAIAAKHGRIVADVRADLIAKAWKKRG